MSTTHTYDPITLEIIQNSFQAAADEMFVAMQKTAMSSIIYEVLDMGTAVLDEHGELASSGAGIPAFVGVLDKTCKVVIDTIGLENIEEGDVFFTNDPYWGAVTHLNDIVVTMPVFHDGELIAWTANIAHNSDVGGMAPGSASGEATEIYQEGLRLPPVKAISKGATVRSVMDIIKTNSRLPDLIDGDLWAAIASVRTGERRLREVAARYGVDTFRAASRDFMDYGEQVSLQGLKGLPHGTFELTEEIDDGRVLSVSITISDDEFIVDLTKNPEQSTAPTNLSRDGAIIPVQMIFKSLTDGSITANSGTFRPIRVLTTPGTVFDPVEPAPMGFYYDLMLPLYDLMWRCMAKEVPELLGAGHFASVCATLMGGTHPDTGRPYSIIEPQIGGWGASGTRDGNSAMFSGVHGDTFNCPAEINEARNGLYVNRMELNTEPGGEGRFTGGRGIVMEYELRADDGHATLAFTRSKFPPWAADGGVEGSPNYAEIIQAEDGSATRYSFASGVPTNPGDVIRIVTGIGGGVGDPKDRDRELVERDIRNGLIDPERAAAVYGV
ncbi:MAG: hydantoinase B/oxoprolinase family protein [Acidimicrobiia bacterium]|nr:hydantoinase B/oxoprolinase family protein [Acidimicrobiia bacterium]